MDVGNIFLQCVFAAQHLSVAVLVIFKRIGFGFLGFLFCFLAGRGMVVWVPCSPRTQELEK